MCSNAEDTGNKAAFSFIEELDEEQRAAALTKNDAVVSAGAGSGKTRVLTARYGALIMTGRCKTEEILTITFTNKAANEMYRRIYTLLAEHAPVNDFARTAVENFHKARISTLDSFCMTIARTVSRYFGISPDFESSDVRVRELARSLALRFVLDKRNNPALQRLIAEKKMRATADELFVKPVLYHSPLSRPLDFTAFEKKQKETILDRWNYFTRKMDEQIALIYENLNQLPIGKIRDLLEPVLSRRVKAPDITNLLLVWENTGALREEISAYCAFLLDFKNVSLRSFTYKTEAALAIKEALVEIKTGYPKLEALANHALEWDIVKDVFPLIDEYQTLLAQKKREAGILTFTDIAHLAVDGLRLYPNIRRMYQDSFKMIMIDEFQDNNSLQRDLVGLLVNPANVFYVGDEKQSIYRFRGADVSVFRSLAETGTKLSLNRNYRSHPALIRAFNWVFGGYRSEDDPAPFAAVFPLEGKTAKDFEAGYRWIKSGMETETDLPKPRLHFAFFDKSLMKDDPDDSFKADDYEAFYIARKIKDMVREKITIRDKDTKRPCVYGDFAVLERSHTHQHSLERAFKLFGIPFYADRPAVLFEDAPVNDLWAFLKLLVYPGDRLSYGVLLRSPLVRLSEDAFTLCMLEGGGIFDETLDEKLAPEDRRRYRQGRRRYQKYLTLTRDLPVSVLLTKLWYGEGYRNEALWSAASQVYLDLYDLFFEQARTIEEQGKGLVDFLDYLEDLAGKKENPDDSALPGEEESGVRIMTIHRCKGLEFPVVFVYNCGSREDTSLDAGLALFSERWGVFLHLPQAEELPETAGDYFYLAEKDDHREKTIAELRRLLYVAMTRAEQELYVTAVIPPQTKDEAALDPLTFGGYNDDYITERFIQYRTNPKINSISFLRLLPENISRENPLYTVEAIYNYRLNTGQYRPGAQQEENISMEAAALAVKAAYETIPAVSPYHIVPMTVNASSLHTPGAAAKAKKPAVQAEFDFDEKTETIDEQLRLAGIKAQEFGLIVHRFIEDRFNGREPEIPARFVSAAAGTNGNEYLNAVSETAKTMAEGFFTSPLGRKAAAAAFRKTEYPILTTADRTKRGGAAPNKILISGKIDLLFESGGLLYVVDFKTDKDEDISRHAGQLAVYKRAVEDIFGKPVECRLFYLRHGRETDMNNIIAGTSVEELITHWEKENLYG
ncbi:ATPase AAA [Spirochaetia bacterium]|nr:ATPase AAA [Spirochaetia bacterium]